MYSKKLHMCQIFSNLECSTFKLYNLIMCNLCTKFVKFLEICKKFSKDLVIEKGNVLRPGLVPRFSDLEVIALSMAFEAEEMDGGENYFCIDSKPIEVCRVVRGKRCKMGKTGAFEKAPVFGYCASQGTYFYGYKLHALCGLSGVIHSYDLSKASVHDINYIKNIKHIYHDCSIFGDIGYIGADVQLDLFETVNIRLESPYRLNQKDWKPTFISFAKARKRVETLFSQLTDQFLVIRNYAKETCNLFARIIGKVSALTALQYINYINNKPIGRIKYALI